MKPDAKEIDPEIFSYLEANTQTVEQFTTALLDVKKKFKGISSTKFNAIIFTAINLLSPEEQSDAISCILPRVESQNFSIKLKLKQLSCLCILGEHVKLLSLVPGIVSELKSLDNRSGLMSLHLIEAEAFYNISNFKRARSALTQSRALATSVYSDSETLMRVDLLSGRCAMDDGNIKAADSYFVEALKTISRTKHTPAEKVLAEKATAYRVLAALISGSSLPQVEFESGASVVLSSLKDTSDINEYTEILESKKEVLDNFICKQLLIYRDTLLDSAIQDTFAPFGEIQISYLSQKVGVSENLIAERIRRLILDGKLCAVLKHLERTVARKPDFSKRSDIYYDDLLNLWN